MLVFFFVIALAVVLGVLYIDRALLLKEVKSDLLVWKMDLELGAQKVEGDLKVHWLATVASLKNLLQKHFNIR